MIVISNLLIHEPPLQVLPSLAVKIGLNEAIILQQLHYWVEKSKNEREGAYWVYNTIEEWNAQFPFWNEKTIRRAFKSLEDKNLIKTGNFNRMPMDRTKWYTIDYMHLDKLSESSGQNDQMDWTKSPNGTGQNVLSNNHRLPKTTTETTTEKKNNVTVVPFSLYSEVIDYLNLKCNTKYKSSSKKTQSLIKARWNEGFKLDDFKTVIDKKTTEWLTDQKMNQYLRPETLFGTKFESYLNQKGGGQAATYKQSNAGHNEISSKISATNERRKKIAGIESNRDINVSF